MERSGRDGLAARRHGSPTRGASCSPGDASWAHPGRVLPRRKCPRVRARWTADSRHYLPPRGRRAARPVSVGAGQAVVEVDRLQRDTERGEGVTRCGEVLIIGETRTCPILSVVPAQCAGWPPVTGSVHRTSRATLAGPDIRAMSRWRGGVPVRAPQLRHTAEPAGRSRRRPRTLSEPCGPPSGQAPPPCRAAARRVAGGDPKESLAGRRHAAVARRLGRTGR
jgi:hypothetical protein